MTLSRFTQALVLATTCLFTVLLGGCGGKEKDGGAGATGDTIKIGAYLSLTGPTATFGQTTQDGILLAVKERNAKGGVNGKQIELILYDNKGETKETGTVVTRLITKDKVVAVLGEVASTQSLAAAPVCQQYGVPMISPSSTNPQVTQVGDMIFRVCFIDPDQGYAGAKFAIDHIKAKKAAILYDQKQAYSTGLAENFKQWFTKLGGEISTEQAYSSGASDYGSQLTNIRDSGAEVVYIPGYYTEVGTIAKQARARGITVPLLGGDGWESPKLTEIGGDAIEGCYYTNHYAPESERPESIAYLDAYRKEYKAESSALAALGYDATNLLFDAMERAGSLKGKDLAGALAATKGYEGVTGEITMDKDRNAKKPMVVIQIEGGKDKYVTTINPPPAE